MGLVVCSRATRLGMAVGALGCFALSNPAAAQSCQVTSLSEAEDVTKAAADNFDCLASKIAGLEASRDAERERAERLAADLRDLQAVMSNAVIAFYRSERGGGACPSGWELFQDAGGRFVVGAGQHQNLDANGQQLRRHPSFSDNPSDAVGDAELHVLALDEIPRHKHEPSHHIISMEMKFLERGFL